jgi:hypothetical protein
MRLVHARVPLGRCGLADAKIHQLGVNRRGVSCNNRAGEDRRTTIGSQAAASPRLSALFYDDVAVGEDTQLAALSPGWC